MKLAGREGGHTAKLGHHDAFVGRVVVDVCGRHPHAGQPRAVSLLDVVRLRMCTAAAFQRCSCIFAQCSP